MSSRRIWSLKEDEVFRRIGAEYQPKNWAVIAKRLASEFGFKKRTGKQCRQRWFNHLDPSIEKKGWTTNDQVLLLALHKQFGNKWTVIADKMPGRSDNSIKNFFYSTVRRNLRRMGKMLGSKNSTGLMREIKPSTMTRIFGSLNEEEDQLLYSYLLKQGLTKDYMRQSCDNIRTQIIHFSSYKPKKSDRIGEEERAEYQRVFELLRTVNDIYEKMREEEKNQRTDKQLFRHYYQEMNRESSDEVDSSMESIEDQDIGSEEKCLKKDSGSTVNSRTTRSRQVKSSRFPHIKNQNVSQDVQKKVQQSRIPETLELSRPVQHIIDSSTLSRQKPQESGLANIVQFAQQVEFIDPEFNIDLNEQICRPPNDQNMGSLEIDTSRMSFKQPACNYGTPVSQVNFFKSPRNVKVTCLSDHWMRMSQSLGQSMWKDDWMCNSNSLKEPQKQSAKKSFQ